MPGPDREGGGWHLFPVLVAPDRRDDFCAHLAAAGIVTGFHYPVLIPDQRAITDRGQPLVTGDLVRARHIAMAEVSLPIHPYLTDDEQTCVIDAVNGWGG
ncbi:MAG: DegT/DnrJ/EryC1/StrS family aminotransferase [Paracoccus sp. (in: a-proteobacteria)]